MKKKEQKNEQSFRQNVRIDEEKEGAKKMNKEELLAIPQGTDGWRDCPNGARVYVDAIILGGRIHGGTIYGGRIYGGVIHGGTIYGGTIYDGAIYGGVIRGGAIHGGTIYGGTIYDGAIYGGVIRGGAIHGGRIYGGAIHSGRIYTTPPQVVLKYFMNFSAPGVLKVGCEEHTIEDWKKYGYKIAEEHNQLEYYKDSIEPLIRWFEAHAHLVEEE